MAILAADNNDGRYNKVHRQTDDGLVISVAAGNSLVPLVFAYKDYLGELQHSLLSSSFFPHAKLMRNDCGWRREDDSVDLLFSWTKHDKVYDGFNDAPSGEYSVDYHETVECVNNSTLKGLRGHRTRFYRKDREYWTPDKTLQAEAPEELFGWEQWNPKSCAPKKPNKCGILKYEEDK